MIKTYTHEKYSKQRMTFKVKKLLSKAKKTQKAHSKHDKVP